MASVAFVRLGPHPSLHRRPSPHKLGRGARRHRLQDDGRDRDRDDVDHRGDVDDADVETFDEVVEAELRSKSTLTDQLLPMVERCGEIWGDMGRYGEIV